MEKTHEHPFFSVQIKTTETVIYSWNFIMPNDHSLIFVGKTVEKIKVSKKKNYKTTELQTKPSYTIEANITYPCKNYIYLPSHFYASSTVEARNCYKSPNRKTIEWFANIAPLLLAIENRDSLLATEIFHKNAPLFMHFPKTMISLLECISIEGLFSWIWGRFDSTERDNLNVIFEGKCTKPFQQWGIAETFFTAARRRLEIIHNSTETIESCLIRYLKSHPGTKITLGIVGTNHYRWVEKTLHTLQEHSQNPNHLFSNTKTIIQSDADNAYDSNALALYVENSTTSIHEEKVLSGYIRKTGAALLRSIYPNKKQFSSRLARLGHLHGGEKGIVVEIIV